MLLSKTPGGNVQDMRRPYAPGGSLHIIMTKRVKKGKACDDPFGEIMPCFFLSSALCRT